MREIMKQRLSLILALAATLGLTSCDKIPGTSSTPEVQCGSETAVDLVKELFQDGIESNTKSIAKNQDIRIDSAGLRANISQVNTKLDNVRTDKSDPQSTKKFCVATLTAKLDSDLVTRANFVREYYGMSGVNEDAFEQDIDMDANTISYELEYTVQPTDDGEKVFGRLENGSEVISFVATAIIDAMQRNDVRALKAQDNKNIAINAGAEREAAASAQIAATEAYTEASNEMASIATEQAKVKATMDFKRSEFNKLWKSASEETRQSLMDNQREWVENRDEICTDRAREAEAARQEIVRMECITELLGDRYYELKEYIDAYD